MANINLKPEEALMLFEAVWIALKNKQMFDHLCEEMDLSPEQIEELEGLTDKLERQLNL